MSDNKVIERWDLVGEYDSYMERIEEGDYVKFEDAKHLLAENERLRAQVEVLERVYYAALDWRNDMALPVDHIRTGKVGGRLLAAIYAVETIDKETPP